MERQVVVFRLGAEQYGVDIHAVEGIIRMPPITPVPRAPEFVEGVANLRGSVLPVVNLGRRLGRAGSPGGPEARVMVVTAPEGRVGLVVDAVSEILRVPEEAVEPPSPMIATLDAAFLLGVARLDERLVILVDLKKALEARQEPVRAGLPG